MGHHVWKVIRSKSVFTRVTDGQRCCYYSLYVILGTGLVSGTATAAHFLVGRQEGYGEFKVMTIIRSINPSDSILTIVTTTKCIIIFESPEALM